MNSQLASNTSQLTNVSNTDWHCHILPGIDDGPSNMDESIAMAQALSETGFNRVYCTPHLIKGSFEADNNTVRETLRELKERLMSENIHLELLLGREYYLDEFFLDYLKEPMPLGNTNFILAEIPSHMEPAYAKEICYRIRCSGYTPMIAHPERCRLLDFSLSSKNGLWKWLEVQCSKFKITKQAPNIEPQTSNDQTNSLVGYLVDLGCQFQGDLGSFAGRYGKAVQSNAEYLRDNSLYTCFGTDAHSVTGCIHKFAI